MPRQLPWKVGAAAKQTSSRPNAAASPALSASHSPAPPHRTTPIPKAESTPDPARKAKRKMIRSSARSPSTSPPPEPLKEELMIGGIDHDDMYRMVEDEFLAVAGDFTRHLHAAEYQRLKGLVKSENANTIQNISRPVTGEMTDLVKRRHAALDTAAKQRKGIAKTLGKRAAGSGAWSEDEDRPRRPATSLQGLMDSPRKHTVLLTSVMGPRPGSSYRNAADASPSRRRPSVPGYRGAVRNSSMDMSHRKVRVPAVRRFNREPTTETEDTEEEDDDDLDGPSRLPSKPAPRRPEQVEGPSARQLPVARAPARVRTEPVAASNPFLATSTARRQTFAQETSTKRHRQAVAREASTDEHGDVPMHDEDDDFFSRLRARRAEQKRRRETKTADSSTKTETQAAAINTIPFI